MSAHPCNLDSPFLQVASTNLQDFYNLVDVYLDAVFHPRCVEVRMRPLLERV